MEETKQTVNLIKLAAHCIHATLLAAKPIQDYRTKSRTKSDGTLVTDADGAAQTIIYNEIRSLDRSIRIVGEESEAEMESGRESCSCDVTDTDTGTGADMNQSQSENEEMFRQVEKDIDTHTSSSIPIPPPLGTSTSTSEDSLSSPTDKTTTVNVNTDTKRVSVFIDPLDGTSSYAKGYYEAVTILVAIIVDNVPVFGVIVKPFGVGTKLHRFRDTDCSVIYGGTLVGGAFVMGGDELERSRLWRRKEECRRTHTQIEKRVGEPDCKRQKQIQEKENGVDGGPSPTSVCTTGAVPVSERESNSASFCKRRAIISKSRGGGVVKKCLESLSSRNLIHEQPLYITGAGYKTMKLLLGEEEEALWFFPKPGTSLWDVAAADALLRVMGGRISDKFGRDLDYGKGRLEADNLDGIIACCDSTLHAKCLELYKNEKWED